LGPRIPPPSHTWNCSLCTGSCVSLCQGCLVSLSLSLGQSSSYRHDKQTERETNLHSSHQGNTSAHGQVHKRQHLHYIKSSDNVLTDALSRNDMHRFQEAHATWLGELQGISDRDDCSLLHPTFAELDSTWGPFEIEACGDNLGLNAHLNRFWCPANSALSHSWVGKNVYCNPPYSNIMPFLSHFLDCKVAKPLGTAALFVLPVWPTHDFWVFMLKYPKVFQIVRRFPIGHRLFSVPSRVANSTARFPMEGIQWPVVIVRAGPGPI